MKKSQKNDCNCEINRLVKLMEIQMAAIDDLKAAVATLQTTVDSAVAKLTTLEGNDAAITQATADITAASTKLASA